MGKQVAKWLGRKVGQGVERTTAGGCGEAEDSVGNGGPPKGSDRAEGASDAGRAAGGAASRRQEAVGKQM